MAPEQFLPGAEVTPAADIYALGLLAYTLIVGTDYWHEELDRDDNVFAFALIAMKGPVEAPSARALRVAGMALAPAFDAWFRKATAVTPQARFATASEAVRQLANALRVNLPTTRPRAASLVGIGPDPVTEAPVIAPDSAHTSRTTPAGSAATMELQEIVVPKRRWGLAAAGAAAVAAIGIAALAMQSSGSASADKAVSPLVAAAESATKLTPPPIAPIPEPPPVAVEQEVKPVDPAQARAAQAAKGRAKAKPGAPKAPTKPIYSRD
jgi:serine/threonine-protein kinase